MSKEITSQDVLIAVKELSSHVSKIENQVSELSSKVSKVETQVSTLDKSVNDRFEALGTRLDTMEKEFKQEFNKTNGKIDVVDTQMEILSSTILKTQAEVRVLQRAK